MRPTVVIVDDHEDFRASARTLLEAEGFKVVGEAADGTETLAAVAALRPNIVLLDIQLPGSDGFDVAEQLASGPGPPTEVLISSRDAAAYGPRLLQTPGFLKRRTLAPQLTRRLRCWSWLSIRPRASHKRYEEAVRRLTNGKSRLESPSDLPFDGLLVHVAGQGRNGFCVVDVFESEEAVERFNQAIGSIPREVGIEQPPEFFPAHTFISE